MRSQTEAGDTTEWLVKDQEILPSWDRMRGSGTCVRSVRFPAIWGSTPSPTKHPGPRKHQAQRGQGGRFRHFHFKVERPGLGLIGELPAEIVHPPEELAIPTAPEVAGKA